MKTKSCLPMVFGFSLILGLALGFYITSIFKPQTTPTPPLPDHSPSTSLGTFLIVGIDHISPDQTVLVSAWLLTPYLDDPADHQINVLFKALYPITTAMVTSPEMIAFSQPHDAIPITSLEDEFFFSLIPLSLMNATWEHTIVIDDQAMNTIIELSDPKGCSPAPTPAPTLFKSSWLFPDEALEQQKSIIQHLCAHPEEFMRIDVINQIVDLIPNNLASTLSKEELISLWQVNINIGNKVSLVCNIFP